MKEFKYILLINLFFFATSVMAQPDDFDPGHEDPWDPGDPHQEVPIDGGALALLAGGAALGYRAIKKRIGNQTKDL